MLTKRKVLFLLTLIALTQGFCEEYATDGKFVVITSSKVEAAYLPEVFTILQEADRELRQLWKLNLPEKVTIVIHPTLSSFITVNQVPWYVAGIANVETGQIDVQRLKVLAERDSLKRTLRHELFHLAQSEEWSRWLAEGLAMHFAGDRLLASPIEGISEEVLNKLLAEPTSQKALYGAMATAFIWSKQHLPNFRTKN